MSGAAIDRALGSIGPVEVEHYSPKVVKSPVERSENAAKARPQGLVAALPFAHDDILYVEGGEVVQIPRVDRDHIARGQFGDRQACFDALQPLCQVTHAAFSRSATLPKRQSSRATK